MRGSAVCHVGGGEADSDQEIATPRRGKEKSFDFSIGFMLCCPVKSLVYGMRTWSSSSNSNNSTNSS